MPPHSWGRQTRRHWRSVRALPMILSRLERSRPPKGVNISLLKRRVVVLTKWLTFQENRQFRKIKKSAWECRSSFSASRSGVSQSIYDKICVCLNWVSPSKLPNNLGQTLYRIWEHGNVGFKQVKHFTLTQFDAKAHSQKNWISNFSSLPKFRISSKQNAIIALPDVKFKKFKRSLSRYMFTEIWKNEIKSKCPKSSPCCTPDELCKRNFSKSKVVFSP